MILIGLGANLDGKDGSPEDALHACVSKFSEHGLNITAASHIWESAPVPISDQPWYKNAVCAVETILSPHEVLKVLAQLEIEAGRVRSVQNAPRVLDLDLLAYHDAHISDNVLSLPHPEMHRRAFVLYPLREIAPNWIHPIHNVPVDEMLKSLPSGQEIRRMETVKLYPVCVDILDRVSA